MDNTPRIEISRPGTFRSTDGREWSFGAADLAAAAAAYDPAGEPAPLVVGHPKLDAPAYGWVRSLAVEGDKLVATAEHLHPDFAEAVKAKSYRRVSASWYPPHHPQNPKPDAWYLKHVGFLGGAAPAIRGLQPVHFSEAQLDGSVTIDLPTAEEPAVATETNDDTADFAEREAALDARQSELDDRQAQLDERDRVAREAEATARHAANVSFAEGMIAGGKLKPFGRDKLVGLLDVLDGAAVAEFGEAGEMAPVDVFKEMLTAAAPFVDFGEVAKVEDVDAAPADFAAPSGYDVDQAGLERHRKALAHQAAHPALSYMDAVKAVS